MKKLSFLTGLVLLTSVCFSQGKLAGKLLAKVAAKVGDATTVTATSLDDVTLSVGIGSNLHPAELGTISQNFFTDWKPGGDQVALTFTSKSQPGICKIDGTVTIDGTPVQYLSIGTYSLITTPSLTPRKIEITMLNGQKSSFTIVPNPKQVKILSINGQKDNVSLDLSKDVVVELDVQKVPENTMLKVSLAINQVSVKSQYDVCYLRSGSTITIPAAAFRNINIAPAGGAVYSYKNSFLSIGVDEMNNATDVSGNWGSVSYTSSYSDGKFVTVTTEPKLNTGLVAKEEENLSGKEVSYDFFKPNAFMSRPSTQIKSIGVVSFAVGGKTFSETSVISQDQNLANNEAQTTKTTTITFPQQTDATWTSVLQKLYPELMTIIQTELNATVLPIETVGKTAGYQSLGPYAVADRNSKEEFSLAYQGTKVLSAVPFSESFGVNSVNEKIMKEAGADALMTFTLNLQLEQDGDFGVVIPTLTFELTGKINGLSTNTRYLTGTVTGKGIPSDKIGLKVAYSSAVGVTGDTKGRNDSKTFQTTGEISSEELDQLIRRSDLVATFNKGIKDILAKEKSNSDYQTVWNLQN